MGKALEYLAISKTIKYQSRALCVAHAQLQTQVLLLGALEYGPPIVKKFRYSLCLETIPNRNPFEISESFRNSRNHFEIFRNHFERNLVSKSFRKSLGTNLLLLFGCILATLSMYCLFQFFAREVSNHGCFSVLPVYCFHVFKRFFQRRRAARVRLVSHHVATGS